MLPDTPTSIAGGHLFLFLPTIRAPQEAHEKTLSITNYQRKGNQNYSEVSAHTGQNGHQ